MSISGDAGAADFLMGRINFERHPDLASLATLKRERMHRLLEQIGNPQERIPAVHIAGTKGKGSTAVMVASALTAAGIRTGLYTSPHINSFTERMQVDGRHPSENEFDALLAPVAAAVARLDAESDELEATYFETLTAMAWEFFSRRQAEIVVLEVGLGGRLDATNLCRPEVTAITNISRDHTRILGETLSQIAFEKAGIMKRGVPCLIGQAGPEARAVFQQVARAAQAPLVEVADRYRALPPATGARRWRLEVTQPLALGEAGSREPVVAPFLGEHQVHNAALAHFLLQTLAQKGWPVETAHIKAAWERIEWPARIEIVGTKPIVILDAAHNWASARALAGTLRTEFSTRRGVLLLAGSREKDVPGMMRALSGLFDTVVLTAFGRNPRAIPVEQLRDLWTATTGRPAHVRASPVAGLALCRSLAGPDDLICATGSFFLAAELRPLLVDTLSIDKGRA